VRSERARRLLDRLEGWQPATLLVADASLEIETAMRPLWRRLRLAVDRAGDGTDVSLHEVRIAAKRVRYAAEALAPAAGARARAFAARAMVLQDVLGRYRDASIATASLGELVDASDPMDAYAAGWIAAGLAAAREHARRAWPAAWRSLAKGRRRFW
jgi:CHAD domain-containing protein